MIRPMGVQMADALAGAVFGRPAVPDVDILTGAGTATVAAEGEDAPDIRPVLNAENLAFHTGVRTSTWEHKRKAAALLFAFLAEAECDVVRMPGIGRVRVGCATPGGVGYLVADGDSLEEATLALWQKRATLAGRRA